MEESKLRIILDREKREEKKPVELGNFVVNPEGFVRTQKTTGLNEYINSDTYADAIRDLLETEYKNIKETHPKNVKNGLIDPEGFKNFIDSTISEGRLNVSDIKEELEKLIEQFKNAKEQLSKSKEITLSHILDIEKERQPAVGETYEINFKEENSAESKLEKTVILIGKLEIRTQEIIEFLGEKIKQLLIG